jgi:hypothetical protein
VNKKLEIILTTLHVGKARRVVSLGMDGKDLAADYLADLARKDRKGYHSILSRMQAVAEYDRIENQLTFRHVSVKESSSLSGPVCGCMLSTITFPASSLSSSSQPTAVAKIIVNKPTSNAPNSYVPAILH